MRIIRIVKKGKKDVVIHFEEEKFLILALEIFLKSGLKKSDEISEDRFSFLIEQNKLFHIKQRAFRLLGRRQHSSSELKRKLWNKDYETRLIDGVISELQEKGYLNDEQFISEFVNEKSKSKNWSSKKIKSELMKRGIDRKLIDLTFNELSENSEYENAMIIARKKYDSLVKRNFELKELRDKLSSYLYSKGFEYDLIKVVCNELINDSNDEV